MTQPPPPTPQTSVYTADLRRQAEALASALQAQVPGNTEALSGQDTQRVLHELRVHQIELEMQNDELRRAQLELDAARARYVDLYDQAPTGYCTLGPDGALQQVNLTACRLLGLPRETLLKQPLTRWIHREDQDTYYLMRQRILETGDPDSCELRLARHAGVPFWASLNAALAYDEGLKGMRLVFHDISAQRKEHASWALERQALETQLQERTAELASARMAADAARDAKRTFLARMSHELRTAMNAIVGLVPLLRQARAHEPADHLTPLSQASQHLMDVIGNLLALSQAEAGRLTQGAPLPANGAPEIADARAQLLQRHRDALILLADDDEVSRQIGQAMLSSVGLRVDLAHNGQQAVERAHERTYALILMDLHMPMMDGREAARAICAHPGNAKTPILALTANAFVGVRTECESAGMKDFIAKPVQLNQLCSVVLKWLDLGQHAAASPTR